jgi:hypothetical protein
MNVTVLGGRPAVRCRRRPGDLTGLIAGEQQAGQFRAGPDAEFAVGEREMGFRDRNWSGSPQQSDALPRAFRTADLWLIHAAASAAAMASPMSRS